MIYSSLMKNTTSLKMPELNGFFSWENDGLYHPLSNWMKLALPHDHHSGIKWCFLGFHWLINGYPGTLGTLK